jgi:hypothetical protein
MPNVGISFDHRQIATQNVIYNVALAKDELYDDFPPQIYALSAIATAG